MPYSARPDRNPRPSIPRTITRQAAEKEPYLLWNAFIDLVATEKYEILSPVQRPAHLVFWYESEVQNGGHCQYFTNRGVTHVAETIESLGLLGARVQQELLQMALEEYRCEIAMFGKGEVYHEGYLPPEGTDEFELPYDELDDRFFRCDPDLCHYLQQYFQQNASEFVVIVG